MVKPGLYRHYKGKIYQVLGTGRHSETMELMVIYQGQYVSDEFGDKPIFVRPYDLFIQEIDLEGLKIPHFKYLDDSHPAQTKIFDGDLPSNS